MRNRTAITVLQNPSLFSRKEIQRQHLLKGNQSINSMLERKHTFYISEHQHVYLNYILLRLLLTLVRGSGGLSRWLQKKVGQQCHRQWKKAKLGLEICPQNLPFRKLIHQSDCVYIFFFPVCLRLPEGHLLFLLSDGELYILSLELLPLS